MAKSKKRYVCQACGSVSHRWQGQCPDCAEWNTLAEDAPATVFSQKHDLSSGGRQVVFGLDRLQQVAVDALNPFGSRIACMEGPARAGELPDFLGDAVHVDGQADPAVADERDPQFLLPHRPPCADH